MSGWISAAHMRLDPLHRLCLSACDDVSSSSSAFGSSNHAADGQHSRHNAARASLSAGSSAPRSRGTAWHGRRNDEPQKAALCASLASTTNTAAWSRSESHAGAAAMPSQHGTRRSCESLAMRVQSPQLVRPMMHTPEAFYCMHAAPVPRSSSTSVVIVLEVCEAGQTGEPRRAAGQTLDSTVLQIDG